MSIRWLQHLRPPNCITENNGVKLRLKFELVTDIISKIKGFYRRISRFRSP